jgi:hypothetical protein
VDDDGYNGIGSVFNTQQSPSCSSSDALRNAFVTQEAGEVIRGRMEVPRAAFLWLESRTERK